LKAHPKNSVDALVRNSARNPAPGKNAKPGKARVDLLLVERGLAPSRERAQALLLAGQVRVNGANMVKAGTQVAGDAKIEIVGERLVTPAAAG
jgi:ribosomal 50S subunit-recycling heat shock protein